MSDSDSDDGCYNAAAEDRSFFVYQLSKYKKALDIFYLSQDAFEKAIPVVSQLGWKERASFVLDNYEGLLMDLHNRPKQLKMNCVGEINELKCFSSAICIGWKLWPDMWIGLQMMVDYLAEDTLTEDILRLDKLTLLTLKEIALCTVWPYNPLSGNMLATQAKIILYRYLHQCSFHKASFDPMDSLTYMFSMLGSFESVASREDPRRICSRTRCIEVETKRIKFKRCSKCKQAFYCSRRCQVKSWKSEHKINCT